MNKKLNGKSSRARRVLQKLILRLCNYTKLCIANPRVLILNSDDYKKRSLDDSSSKSESDSLGIYEHVDPIKFTDDGSFAEHVGTYKRFADDSLDADATATSALSSLV